MKDSALRSYNGILAKRVVKSHHDECLSGHGEAGEETARISRTIALALIV